MENLKEQQVEALKAIIDYNKKLVPALEEISKELRGEQKEDTKEYLNYILKGVNWVIEVVNGTQSLISNEKEVIEKEEVNHIIVNLNQAIKEENNIEIASIIEGGILPFIAKITKVAGIAVVEGKN